jgi:small subunit ribosomal protein S6
MKSYESIFIVPTDLSPQRVDELTEKFKAIVVKNKGENIVIEKWGRRRLAYPIGRQREGYYTFMQFNAEPSFVAELNQFFRVSEEVIRQLICLALKGKPSSPMMVLPPAVPHESHGHGHRPPPHGAPSPAASVPVPAAAGTSAPVAVAAPSEVSHADSHSPRPA